MLVVVLGVNDRVGVALKEFQDRVIAQRVGYCGAEEICTALVSVLK